MPRTDASLVGILIESNDSAGLITLGTSAGSPVSTATAASKFAVGCVLEDTTTGKTYNNVGTVAVPSWNSSTDIVPTEITLASAKILVGAATGLAAAVDMSADATIANTGALTIANNAVTTVKIADGNVTNAKIADSTGAGALSVPKSAQVLYDFSVVGGALGPIALTGSPTIPDNAVVWLESYDVITTCTSATDAATLKLSFQTDGDITTALAISNGANPWDAGAFVVSQGALASPLPKKLTAARALGLVVAGGENLTAGKIVFNLRYYVTL